jgi:hypothetical protein
MEYDDTFYSFSHCDLTVLSICWGDGVWWHLSFLCSVWPYCRKYLLRGWSTMTPFIPFSYCDLTVWIIYWGDGVRWYFAYLFSLWPHCMKYLLRGWSIMTPFTPFLIVTSLYQVLVKGMEYDDIFHTSAHCDLTVWSMYWGDGVRWYLSYLFSLWPHCMKYLLWGWSTMILCITFLIVTSLYEVFIEGTEYDDTLHTFSLCDLIVWSIYW